MASVLIVMIHVGVVEPHPNSTMAFPPSTFKSAMTSALNIVLAYSGHVTYFGFFSELKDPKEFKKSLILLQTTAITVYTIVAVVIYNYVGPDVRAPALSSASSKVAKIAYAVAIPTIIIAGVLNAHVASMAFYQFIWSKAKKPDVVKEKTVRAWASWIAIVGVVWFLAWIIAESIPIFEYLLALVSALFSGWYSCKWFQLEHLMGLQFDNHAVGITSFLYWYLNKGQLFQNRRQTYFTLLNIAILCIGVIIVGLPPPSCSGIVFFRRNTLLLTAHPFPPFVQEKQVADLQTLVRRRSHRNWDGNERWIKWKAL
jgi:hypothetical protein